MKRRQAQGLRMLLWVLLLAAAGSAWATTTGMLSIQGPAQPTGTGGGTVTITIPVTISGTAENFSETATFGPYSTASSVASWLAARFSQDYASKGLCAHAVGPVISYMVKGSQATAGTPSGSGTGSTGGSGSGSDFSIQLPSGLYSLGAGYDGHGNMTIYNDSVAGNWSFGYDQVNRLTGSTAATAGGPYAGQYACWTYDAFGNRQTEAISATPCANSPAPTSWASSNTNNQITSSNLASSGYTYSVAGNVLNDGVNAYLYDAEGRMCAEQTHPVSGGVAMVGYIYDAEGHRVAKGTITSWSCDPSANGFQATEQAVYDTSGRVLSEADGHGNWQRTNVYANGELLATYDGAGLHYFLHDPAGTRRVQVSAAGVVEGVDTSLPWGNGYTQTAADDPNAQHYAQLSFDAETGLDHAGARQYAPWTGLWTAPDPYNGSYDLYNPQSLNRYAYVNDNPLGFVDPSGLAGGVTGWSGVCKIGKKIDRNAFQGFGGFNPCNPVASIIAFGIANSALDAIPNFIANSIDSGINSMFNTSLSTNVTASMAQVTGYVNAAFTVACSIDNFNSSMCGPSGWTSVVFGKDSNLGKGVNDAIALTGAILCADPGTAEACFGYAIYSAVNAAFSWIWSAFSGPKFTGSLLPRPADMQGLGTSPIGIPDKNLTLQEILGQTTTGVIPTPAP